MGSGNEVDGDCPGEPPAYPEPLPDEVDPEGEYGTLAVEEPRRGRPEGRLRRSPLPCFWFEPRLGPDGFYGSGG